MKDLFLIAVIAGETVAFPSERIDSVVKVRESVPVPSAAPFISGLFALRSRVLTLIDCQFFVTGEPAELVPGQPAIVVNIGGCSYGLLVDDVLDVAPIRTAALPLPSQLPAGWSEIGRSLLELDGETLLLIDPDYMVNPATRRAA
ncbi:MAG: chemotaxis protein CheW [Blastomonas sp. CACIA14H2]|jgi:purine-binding chemotaxis protein CheW|uniref:chemotaxis protein CheW n=1 Tax=unclassified Blastomonas TaxID=2626550 RepID=UPI0003CFD9AE|nr:MAG: chemotaxis protein CheW [Blastomonas sp. CACIA14H2]